MMFFLTKKHRSSCDQESSPSFNLDVKRSKNIKSSLPRMVTRCKNGQSPAELGASRAPQAPEVCLKQSSVLLDCRLLHRLSHGAPKGRSRFLWKSGWGGSICRLPRIGAVNERGRPLDLPDVPVRRIYNLTNRGLFEDALGCQRQASSLSSAGDCKFRQQVLKQQRVGLEPFDSFRFKLKRRAWFFLSLKNMERV